MQERRDEIQDLRLRFDGVEIKCQQRKFVFGKERRKVRVLKRYMMTKCPLFKEMNSCHQGTRGGGERAPLPFLLFGDVCNIFK